MLIYRTCYTCNSTVQLAQGTTIMLGYTRVSMRKFSAYLIIHYGDAAGSHLQIARLRSCFRRLCGQLDVRTNLERCANVVNLLSQAPWKSVRNSCTMCEQLRMLSTRPTRRAWEASVVWFLNFLEVFHGVSRFCKARGDNILACFAN